MKISKTMFAAVAATMLAAAPAAAADEAQSANGDTTAAASETKQTNAKGERLICKRFNRTESRLKSIRACHTAEDWKKLEKEAF